MLVVPTQDTRDILINFEANISDHDINSLIILADKAKGNSVQHVLFPAFSKGSSKELSIAHLFEIKWYDSLTKKQLHFKNLYTSYSGQTRNSHFDFKQIGLMLNFVELDLDIIKQTNNVSVSCRHIRLDKYLNSYIHEQERRVVTPKSNVAHNLAVHNELLELNYSYDDIAAKMNEGLVGRELLNGDDIKEFMDLGNLITNLASKKNTPEAIHKHLKALMNDPLITLDVVKAFLSISRL